MVGVRLLVGLACVTAVSAAFGLTTETASYTVDSGAGLVFKVRRTDTGSSTQSIGDIYSLKYNGKEFQDTSKGSQVNSGFDWLYDGTGSVKISAETISSTYIKITITAVHLTHYYIVKSGVNNIYMGSYFTQEPNIHGHVRFILRLTRSMLPNGPTPSDIGSTTKTVEASDVFALSNGQTRSKHYSNMRLKDWTYIGATGSSVGVYVVRGNQEGGSGGPFYRSLLNQGTSTSQEITYIVNYGEAQTEAFRMGILNDYTLVFTSGGTPGTIDTSFFSSLSLLGYVASSGRGAVSGVGITNRDSSVTYTVGFAATGGQYWADADSSSGYFKCSNMRPGTYTLTVYKNELAVHTTSGVVVKAGSTTTLNSFAISNDPSSKAAVWRIGKWDGSPQEFLNGAYLTYMHPSDTRITTWNPGNFIVGTHGATRLPAYMWKSVNSGYKIYFTLSSAYLSKSLTVRFGMTCGFAGARPRLTINSYTTEIKSAPSQPDTRTLTVGSYRGNNLKLEFVIPASAWVKSASESNIMTIDVVSGSSGDKYLSPGFSIDCIDLIDPTAASGSTPPAPSPPSTPSTPKPATTTTTPKPPSTPKPATPATPAPAPLTSASIADGTYTIASKHSSKLVEVADSSTANGGNVQQYTANGCKCQSWEITSVGSGYYKIVNANSRKAMDVSASSKDDGANVLQWEYAGGANQQWQIVSVDGYYAFVNKNSGKALDVWDWSTEDGGNIAQYAYWAGASQLWKLTKVSSSVSPPTSSCTSYVAAWGDCISNHCCVSGYTCYKANDYYAQCRTDCAVSGWSCTKLS